MILEIRNTIFRYTVFIPLLLSDYSVFFHWFSGDSTLIQFSLTYIKRVLYDGDNQYIPRFRIFLFIYYAVLCVVCYKYVILTLKFRLLSFSFQWSTLRALLCTDNNHHTQILIYFILLVLYWKCCIWEISKKINVCTCIWCRWVLLYSLGMYG